MKHIYIVLSQSGSIVSKAIKQRTKKQYNHCSIAFDPQLNVMYSMGRLYPNNPLLGRFVKEVPNVGTYKKFKDTTCKVLEVAVSDKAYDKMKQEVDRLLLHNIKYDYSGLILGAVGIASNNDSTFVCSTLLRHIFIVGGLDVSFLPKIPHPTDFEMMNEYKVVYQGLLNELGN